ncbi:unnamed protein product, partial [Effrenium voratum]
ATCAEPDFLADLADSLQPKVHQMGCHEVSVAFQVFAPVSYAVPLLPAVAARAKDLVPELSPKQLAHLLRGLREVDSKDPELLSVLKARAGQLSHAFFGTHAVSVLVAFADAEQVDAPLVQSLSETILRHLDRLSAE